MKIMKSHEIKTLCAYCFLFFTLIEVILGADMTLFTGPTNGIINKDSAAAVDFEVQSSTRSVGALSVVLGYNPAIVQIAAVLPAANSRFVGNVFADTSSFATGSTKIVAFQTKNPYVDPDPRVVFTVVFQAVGASSTTSALTVSAESFVDGWWRPATLSTLSGSLAIDNADADHDGLPDRWEAQYFGGPQAANPSADEDGDGFTNLQEWAMKTNPRDSTSGLFIHSAGMDLDSFQFDVTTQKGVLYRVECSENLTPDSWNSISPAFWGNGFDMRFVDTGVRGVIPKRFYRVKIALP